MYNLKHTHSHTDADADIDIDPDTRRHITLTGYRAILHIHDGGCGDYRLNLNYTYLPNCYLDIKNHRIEFFDAKYDFSNNDSDWVLFSTLRKNSENVTLFDEELLN
eukprot:Pgem_evm1s6532